MLLAAIGFLITSINGIENRMYQVESKMMQLIDGQIEQECPDMNKEQR